MNARQHHSTSLRGGPTGSQASPRRTAPPFSRTPTTATARQRRCRTGRRHIASHAYEQEEELGWKVGGCGGDLSRRPSCRRWANNTGGRGDVVEQGARRAFCRHAPRARRRLSAGWRYIAAWQGAAGRCRWTVLDTGAPLRPPVWCGRRLPGNQAVGGR